MSEVKVNKISPRTACGTVTLGDSGDTFTIPSGATITNSGTATGFGRTGTVDWVTTVKVTGDSPITAVTGEGYFLNTTAGTITVNLPAGVAGSIVSLADYASTWATNNVTVSANGSEKIGGNTADAILSTTGQSVTLIYIDGTQGWVTTADSTENIVAKAYVTATGGTPCSGATVCTNYKTHTFTGPGTFCVSSAGNAAGSNTVDYLVVAGGGGGGQAVPMPGTAQGGGGGGGFRESPGTASGCYTVSPLGVSPAAALTVSATPYTITVGGGGAINTAGVNSIFSTITSAGGGEGGCRPSAPFSGGNGGSGGGGAYGAVCTGGTGNTPSVTPAQGTDGGSANASNGAGAGGGGATVAATDISGPASTVGGAGATTSISATPTAYAGGAGGGNDTSGQHAAGGAGGGGTGGSPSSTNATAGIVNTGGGGGGSGNQNPSTGGAGGSGVVIIRYKFQ